MTTSPAAAAAAAAAAARTPTSSLKGFVIPPLQPGDRICDWKPLFKAAVTSLLTQENGEKLAIDLLPGYINRRTAEKELVRHILDLSICTGWSYLFIYLLHEHDGVAFF